MRLHTFLLLTAAATLAFSSCKKDDATDTKANLQFQFNFDAAQPRLNNIGLPAAIPTGNAAQTPDFKQMSVHYIELAPAALTALGKGAIVYHAAETSKGVKRLWISTKPPRPEPTRCLPKSA